jgi:hypothetical protein
MTGIKDHNYPAFYAAAANLRELGYSVVNPAELDEGNQTREWEYYLRRDLAFVIRAEQVVVLPGWEKSKGARLEAHLAQALGTPVYAYPSLAPVIALPEGSPLTPAGIEQTLRETFPNGHPDFLPLLTGIAQLHSDKNHDYAGGGNPLGNFQRVASLLGNYPGFPASTPVGVALVYALKQLDAVLWGLAKSIEHRVEGLESRLTDIAVYALLAIIMLRDQKGDKANVRARLRSAA